MPEIHHHVQLVIEHGELHRNFVCTAPEDAPCRRRPADFADGGRESWTADEATKTGYPCWAVDWVEAVGIEDAIYAYPDQVLASVPVEISYDEGVEITPAVSVQGEPEWEYGIEGLVGIAPSAREDKHTHRRTKAIPAGPWVPLQAPEGEEKR